MVKNLLKILGASAILGLSFNNPNYANHHQTQEVQPVVQEVQREESPGYGISGILIGVPFIATIFGLAVASRHYDKRRSTNGVELTKYFQNRPVRC